tara:strand:- start:3159 stop:3575 length:417 start_codon:yes stop_codon:yes gene_type:complete
MRPNRKHKDGMLSVASIKRQLLMPVSSRSQFERYEHNIPTTIANWFNATSLPRILAGDISVIYIGETTDAMPTPSPPINLAMTNSIKVRGKAEKTAEIKKRRLQSIRTFFLPAQSAIRPAIKAPKVHAIIKLLTAKPS